ncbi:DUF308 domain-containing protein [Mycobacterium shimoidei]|uniref:DUF308 domain-containing protein n=1 Tax=Mycobacterium shimoidei TaxID=29313 RepID=UPI0008485F8D|nr:DUF308 domain-containing protein [Mycobacterium shimoidei]MCV7261139.1 hypothetical protein [Mycobacterium shimoidei]ODR08628.1 hypothetical protein BHQ16_20255 [Mycobacterium shimoidei]ORW82956.1 hypothetical protein AWC26_03910 [Mycobacterium shimoidei]
MLISALVLAVIGLAALVFAVVTSNQLVAWVCIAASVVGVILLIIDALQERQRRQAGASADQSASTEEPKPETSASDYEYADYPEEDAETADQPGRQPAQPVKARSDDESSSE